MSGCEVGYDRGISRRGIVRDSNVWVVGRIRRGRRYYERDSGEEERDIIGIPMKKIIRV